MELGRCKAGRPKEVFLQGSVFFPSSVQDGPIAQMRLERTPDKREVGSSTLPRPTIRGCSSAGRAPALHAGGHRFDPVHLQKSGFEFSVVGF